MKPQQSENSGSGSLGGTNPSSGNGNSDQQNQYGTSISSYFYHQPPQINNMTMNFCQPGNYSVLMDMSPCPAEVALTEVESGEAAAAMQAAYHRFLNQRISPAVGGAQANPGLVRRLIAETQFTQTVAPWMLSPPANRFMAQSPPPSYHPPTPILTSVNTNVNPSSPIGSFDNNDCTVASSWDEDYETDLLLDKINF